MKYIKIFNKSNGVNRLHLEKLGMSTKRNDPDTIGQFGSGIKYAPISAIRMGLDFAFVGFDDKGSYQLRYTVVDEDGIDAIVYDYGNYQKPSSFTVDAGSLSWDSEWQIYREIVSNAMDNGNWARAIVDEINNEDGEFAIYVTASPNMMEIYNEHDKYFSRNREVIYTCDRTDIKFLQKYDRLERLYNKGVLCHTENTEFSSMFDYDFPNGDLNEDRSFKYVSTERIKICKAIAGAKDNNLIEEILEESFDRNIWEFNFISDMHWSFTTPSNNWKRQFHKMYGDNAVIVSPEQSIVKGLSSLITAKGKKSKYCTSNGMFTFLRECGIPTCEDLIDEKYEYDTDDDVSKYPKLVEAMKIASYFEPGLLNMQKQIIVFDTKGDELMLGLTVNVGKEINDRQIMIAKHHAEGSTIRELVATIIHEYDHYSSGIGDSMYREFRSLADSRISKLMTSMYKETPAYIHNGAIKIKLKDLPMFSSVDFIIQPVEKTSWHLARIGKLTFKLDIGDEKISLSGVAMPNKTGEELEINIGRNGTISRLD